MTTPLYPHPHSAIHGAVAALFQAGPTPPVAGVAKPPRPGGYSDSSADIIAALQREGVPVVVPARTPDVFNHLDWCFPDTREGIMAALEMGAKTFWLNTVLFSQHPIVALAKEHHLRLVGQRPADCEVYDDKFSTNNLLRASDLPVSHSIKVSFERDITSDQLTITDLTAGKLGKLGLHFPMVIKPIRGRGSFGVAVVEDCEELCLKAEPLRATGKEFMIEEFLPGTEITITVMPPGEYTIKGQKCRKSSWWSLPAVERFNHQNGVAPFNGTVAVVYNSRIATENADEIRRAELYCEQAALLIRPAGPIRIDCRARTGESFILFDLNMKPNLSGKGRPGREDYDGLSTIAAQEIGWGYGEFIKNLYLNAWKL